AAAGAEDPMQATTRFLYAAFVGALTLGAGAARADVAPPDMCTSPGQPCQTAGPGHNQAGTCMPATCSRAVHTDKGFEIDRYGCNRCEMGSPVTGGASGGAGGLGSSPVTTPSGAVGATPSTTTGRSSGCALAGRNEAGDLGSAVFALVGFVLVL